MKDEKGITTLANFLFPFIKEYFASDEGKKAYEEWQRETSEEKQYLDETDL